MCSAAQPLFSSAVAITVPMGVGCGSFWCATAFTAQSSNCTRPFWKIIMWVEPPNSKCPISVPRVMFTGAAPSSTMNGGSITQVETSTMPMQISAT